MNRRIFTVFWAYTTVLALRESDDVCRNAYVPCPRAPGFLFFNHTCYAVIRDAAGFSAADARSTCQSGVRPALSSGLLGYEKEQIASLASRMSLARVTSRPVLRALTTLLEQVVNESLATALIDLSCSADRNCSEPDGWLYSRPDSHVETPPAACVEVPICNWVQNPPRSAWTHPPTAPPPVPPLSVVVQPEDSGAGASSMRTPSSASGSVAVMETHHRGAVLETPESAVGGRVAVLESSRSAGGLAQLVDVSSEKRFHVVACELLYYTALDSGNQLLAAMTTGIDVGPDLALTGQQVTSLAVRAVADSVTRAEVSWIQPACRASRFYISTQIDGDRYSNRTEVSAQDVCGDGVICHVEMDLRPCSSVYIRVGAILDGIDAVASVTQWETTPNTDPPPPPPLGFHITSIQGLAVTLAWKPAPWPRLCQPHHKVTLPGHGEVTAAPGQTEVTVNLTRHCSVFSASIRAVVSDTAGEVIGPIGGFTQPPAPSRLIVSSTGATWTHLRWSPPPPIDSMNATGAPPCPVAKYRVVCRSQSDADTQAGSVTESRQSVTATAHSVTVSEQSVDGEGLVQLIADQRKLNVSGLLSSTRYRCGVCALAEIPEIPVSGVLATEASCGNVRFVTISTRADQFHSPGWPQQLRAVTVQHNLIELTWRPPRQTNNDLVNRYIIVADCKPETFPLCSDDPLCRRRQWIVNVTSSDDVMRFNITGLQAARLYSISMAAVTAAVRGEFSLPPLLVATPSGVPPAPRHVAVATHTLEVPGLPERTSISVSLLPPCPYPGLHQYRLRLEQVDFFGASRSSIRSRSLSERQVQQLYAGDRNLTFPEFDGKWTPGLQYRVRVVVVSQNDRLGDVNGTSSEAITFNMTVPPPGPVRDLYADCSSPLKLSFGWVNPTKHAFGVVSYTSHYRCRQPATGREVGGSHRCSHNTCPCASSVRAFDQCRVCEQRVCSYPLQAFNFMGAQHYYFNCSCRFEVSRLVVPPGSVCKVFIQATSRFQRRPGELANASCKSQPHVALVKNLSVSVETGLLVATWNVPLPLEVPTKQYHVLLRRDWQDNITEIVKNETISGSQCRQARCQYRQGDLSENVTYSIIVAAESEHAVPPVGPGVNMSFIMPFVAPWARWGDMQRLLLPADRQYRLAAPSRQLALRLPPHLFSPASRAPPPFRSVRLIVLRQSAETSQSALPQSGDVIADIPYQNGWREFAAGRVPGYQIMLTRHLSNSSNGSDPSGSERSEFVVGADITCGLQDMPDDACNGPLEPNTVYSLRLLLLDAAHFIMSPPVVARTRSLSEMAQRRPPDLPAARHLDGDPHPDLRSDLFHVGGDLLMSSSKQDEQHRKSKLAVPDNRTLRTVNINSPPSLEEVIWTSEAPPSLGTAEKGLIGSVAAMFLLTSLVILIVRCMRRQWAGGLDSNS